jgi:ABC-type Fe3+-siderophore transport system permease subunit
MEESKRQEIATQKIRPAMKIRRGVFGELTIHEVLEDELDTLAHGTPDSVYLSFATFLLSTATAFLVSLLTTQVSDRTFLVFVVLVVLGYVLGALFSILWYKNRRSISILVRRIRERLPPEGIQEVWTLLDEPGGKKE